MKHFLAAALTIFPASAGFGQDLPAEVLSCRNVTVDAVRLACFDRVTDPAKANASAAAGAPESTDAGADQSPWTVTTDSSAMTDDTNHFVATQSSEPVQCQQYTQSIQPLTLMARCMEDTTALIVFGQCHVASGFSGYGEVTWRTDTDKPKSRDFSASTDSTGLGLWSGNASIPAIKELFGKEKLVLRFTPFGMSPVEATFDISGLEEAIAPLREECGW